MLYCEIVSSVHIPASKERAKTESLVGYKLWLLEVHLYIRGRRKSVDENQFRHADHKKTSKN